MKPLNVNFQCRWHSGSNHPGKKLPCPVIATTATSETVRSDSNRVSVLERKKNRKFRGHLNIFRVPTGRKDGEMLRSRESRSLR